LWLLPARKRAIAIGQRAKERRNISSGYATVAFAGRRVNERPSCESLSRKAMCFVPAIALHIHEARSTIQHKLPVVLGRYACDVCAIES
jgi:hypothetical protein